MSVMVKSFFESISSLVVCSTTAEANPYEIVEFTVYVENVTRHTQVVVDYADGTRDNVTELAYDANVSCGRVAGRGKSAGLRHVFRKSGNYTVTAIATNQLAFEQVIKNSTSVRVRTWSEYLFEMAVLVNGDIVYLPGDHVEFVCVVDALPYDSFAVLSFGDGFSQNLSLTSSPLLPSYVPEKLRGMYASIVVHQYVSDGVFLVTFSLCRADDLSEIHRVSTKVYILSLREAIGEIEVSFSVGEHRKLDFVVLFQNFVPGMKTVWNYADGSEDDVLFIEEHRPSIPPKFVALTSRNTFYPAIQSHLFKDDAHSNITIVFSVERNGFIQEFSIQKLVELDSCVWPSVDFVVTDNSARSLNYFRNESVVLRARRNSVCYPKSFIPKCYALQVNSTGYQMFENCSIVVGEDSDNLLAVLPPFTLPFGEYKVEIEGQFRSNDGRLVTVSSNGTCISITALPLFAFLDTLQVNYSFLETILLNASLSQDPNEQNGSLGLEFDWACAPDNWTLTSRRSFNNLSRCISTPLQIDHSSPWLQFEATLLSSTDLPQLYTFYVRVRKLGFEEAATSISLTLVISEPPEIVLVCLGNCDEFIDPTDRLVLTFECKNCLADEPLRKVWGFWPNGFNSSITLKKVSPVEPSDTIVLLGRIFTRAPLVDKYDISLRVTRQDQSSSLVFYNVKVNHDPPSQAGQSIDLKSEKSSFDNLEIKDKPLSAHSSLLDNPESKDKHLSESTSDDSSFRPEWYGFAALLIIIPTAVLAFKQFRKHRRRPTSRYDRRHAR